MNLTQEQIAFIELDVRARGVMLDELVESMVDHLCCQVECSADNEFDVAYDQAIAEFDNNEFLKVQEEIQQIDWQRKNKWLKKVMYSFGFIATFLITTGILFKTMHWPGAGISLLSGVVILNTGFLPMYFYDRYKQAVKI